MSNINGTNSSNLLKFPVAFPALMEHLDKSLAHMGGVMEGERIVQTLKGLLQSSNYSTPEKQKLRRVYQKAYDRYRYLRRKAVAEKTESLENPMPEQMEEAETPEVSVFQIWNTVRRCLIPAGWLLGLVPITAILFWQSLSLYQSAGFGNAVLAAAGGLIMLLAVAAYYSLFPSVLALSLCLYAGGYEMVTVP